MAENNRVSIAQWKRELGKDIAGKILYPLVFFLNRPAFSGITKALYDFSLQCNGIAIAYPGANGLTRSEESFLRRSAKILSGGVIIDVGAHVGIYSQIAAKLIPNAKIYAFEPHPRTFAHLKTRIDPARIEVYNEALGEHCAALKLYDFADTDGISTQASLREDAVRFFTDRIISHDVPCTTLDEFMMRKKIDRVALLKIDTEGHDIAVLRGAKTALREKRIDMIQFEFIPANIATGITMRSFFNILEGYEIYRMCLNGSLLRLAPYDTKRCEIYVTQNLIAKLKQTV